MKRPLPLVRPPEASERKGTVTKSNEENMNLKIHHTQISTNRYYNSKRKLYNEHHSACMTQN